MKDNIKKIHDWAWIALIVFIVGGIFYPPIGILAIVCMLAPIFTAFFKGRYWCQNFCPRGSFNDVAVSKISRKNKIPKILTTKWFKILFLVLIMGAFVVQIIFSWGNVDQIGFVFVRMVLITTLLSILLGAIYSRRTWCVICPMGNIAHMITSYKSKHKKIECDCKNCSRACNKEKPINN